VYVSMHQVLDAIDLYARVINGVSVALLTPPR
jgi:hypothetical protein